MEADTYRIHAHTNADDPSRYRADDEVEEWRPRDPLLRLKAHLTSTGALSAEREAEFAAAAEEMAAAAPGRDGPESPPLDPAELFAHVYATPTPQLDEQAALLRSRADARSRPDERPEADDGPGPQPALRDAMTADDSVVVFGEDVGPLGGVFRVTDGLTADFGEQRCFDTPLAESGIVGMAIGMAMNGMRPVVEMQFDAFAYPAFEQIVSHVAKMANRTRGRVRLPMVIRIPYAGGIGGVEHH